MERREFLSALGLGAVTVMCAQCLTGCKQEDPISAPTNVDFIMDLANPAYAILKTAGGYVYNAGVVVAHTANDTYVAVSQACTHAGANVVYDLNSNSFYCPSHGSVFALSGAVTRGPAGSPLGSYKTALTGNSLRVYS
jgi:cytochrome b6-f complex iron-sulfur subunit